MRAWPGQLTCKPPLSCRMPPFLSEGDKQSGIVGPRDPPKEKTLVVGVDIFLNKNLAVTSSVSLLTPESPCYRGRPEITGGWVSTCHRWAGLSG